MAAFTAVSVEALEKVSKIGMRLLDAASQIAGSLSAPVTAFQTELKDAVALIEMLKIFGATRLLFCKDKGGHILLTNKHATWEKKADRICLFIHSIFKVWKGFKTLGFAQYGVLAKNAIGKLPFFTLIGDGLMIMSSSFGLGDQCKHVMPPCAQ